MTSSKIEVIDLTPDKSIDDSWDEPTSKDFAVEVEVEGPRMQVTCDRCRKTLDVSGVLWSTPDVTSGYLVIAAHECAWKVIMGFIRISTAHYQEGMDPHSFIAGLVGAQGFSLVPGSGV